MLQNAIRAARLDVDFYNTVEKDSAFTGQAAMLVLVVSALTGLGTAFVVDGFLWPIISTTISGLVGWVVWSAIALFIGTRLFGGEADMGEMLRVLGYAQAPRALAVIPAIGAVVGGIWALVAAVIAIREGHDFGTGQAIATVVVGWLAFVILVGIWNFIF